MKVCFDEFFPSNKKSLSSTMTSILCPQNYVLKATQTNIWFSYTKLLTPHLTERNGKLVLDLNWTSQHMDTFFLMVFELFWVACNKTLMTSRNITLITLFSYSLHFPIGKMTLGGLWNEEAAANKSPSRCKGTFLQENWQDIII